MKKLIVLLILIPISLCAQETLQTESSSNAQVYIISPKDGEKVNETFTVKFGLKGMGVAPAGVDKENTGHHHLLVDTDLPKDLTKPLGSDVKHFGGGQTEVDITLEKGDHSLQLILGNMFHVPHSPAVYSKKINVIVE